jgi:hypothetical protein
MVMQSSDEMDLADNIEPYGQSYHINRECQI